MTQQRSYRFGDTGPAVADIRHRLALLELLGEAPPASAAAFDGHVDTAVRAFQQERGLSVDGIVGPRTLRALEEARWRLGDRILSYAVTHLMAGDDVAALQQRLLDMGFDCGRVDGFFGAETATALQDFQRNVGLVADGTCGPLTFQALDRLARTVTGGRAQALRDDESIARRGPRLSGKVVVIDPGHGGPDRGIVAGGLEEATVVEDLAARIEGRLAATGVLAFLTRGRGTSALTGRLEDEERAAFANAAEADVVISLHCDGCECSSASGVATFYYGHYGADGLRHSSPLGQRFADLVQREVVARTDLADARTHAKTWDLLRRTRMPAVRLELGYLTNPRDAARLADPGFRDVVAEAVVVAVQRLYLPVEDDAPTGTLVLPELAVR